MKAFLLQQKCFVTAMADLRGKNLTYPQPLPVQFSSFPNSLQENLAE